MAIDIKFDLMGNPEPPSIVLANRNGNKLGQLNVNVESVDVKDKFNDISEFSFTLNKYIDGEPTPLWDKVVDFKLVNCPEWDLWFEITVELDETTETVKTVYCTQLGQAELSQIMIYNTEINTEADIEREDFKTSILYDEKNPKSSILHRLLEKAPHYSIAYVDESIQRIQRQFSFDGVSICDAFNEIAEEIGCLFVYNSNSQAGGKPNRTISVYDLQQNCNNKDCKHRGEFTDKCPKCGSTDITYGYGEDTTIFVTADELATEGIQLVTDADSVKNCFKLEAGDDLMTATIRNCNPNGSDYIWYFSDSMKEDMSKELVDRIEGYDELYKEHYNSHISQLNGILVNQYNNLVAKYDDYYNTKSTCLDCKNEGDFEEQCPKCNSKNILVGQKLQTIPTTITGYPALMTAYYNTIDLLLYLESGLMPNVEMSGTTAEAQVGLLTTPSLTPVAVNVKDIKNASEATANSAVLSMAKVLIRPTYKVDIVDGSSSLSQVDANGEYKTWTGKFVVTNYSDDKDTATSDIISVRINNAAETFVEQKIDKALNKENTDDYSIAGLFSKDYDDFCKELKKYALKPLDSFSKACDTCISILTEQGAGDEDGKPDLYAKLYKPYFDKQQAINDEIKVRESEIAIIEGVWDMSDENNPKCTTKGLQQYIEDCQKEIQDALNFEGYLGEDLWLEFCAYRREDKYSNSNYISDGLDNAELFKKANEFIEVAQEEIFKSAELQHSISANLNNLLALPKFKPLLKSFKTGNWIRVRIDDKVYKLRLLEYNFGYGDSKNISVEFSDVTKIKNGTTDVQDVFEQASSMASSYDSVQRQAQKGNVARSTIDQWIVDGLNSANVQIQSNDSEEIILTQSGLLARSYDDITGTYSPEQFKLTHNILAYTDDNWETVSAALGKHNYKYYKDGNFVDAEGYGVSAKFAQAAYIIGSQVISGEIVSSNYEPNTKGTYFDLNKGDFEIAGGKIAYNATSDIVTLDGVTIVWDDGSTNAPTIAQIDGLSDILEDLGNLSDGAEQSAKDYADKQDEKLSDTLTEAYQTYTDTEISTLDSYVAKYLGVGGNTIVGDNYLISPYIGGGYLNIANTNNNSRVIIDPNNLTGNGYIFQVHNGDKMTVGVDSSGNSTFSGKITASDFIGGSLLIGDETKVNDYAEITNDGTLTCTNVDIRGGVLKIGSEYDENGNPIAHTWISPNGVLNTYDANISGEIRAAKGQIGGFTIEPTETEEGVVKPGGWLYSGELQEGQTSVQIGDNRSIFLSATDMSGTMPFSQLIARTDENGDIVADENGDIIYDTAAPNLFKDDWRITVGSNFGITSDGTVYMSNCEIAGGSLRMGTESDGYHTWISEEGILNAWGANISGAIHVSAGGTIGGWDINDYSIASTNDATLLYSGSDEGYQRTSLVDNSTSSPVRFCSGYNQTATKTITVTEHIVGSGATFEYSPVDCKEITEVVSCETVNGNGSVRYSVEGNTLTVTYAGSPSATIETIYTYIVTDPINYAPFAVLEDGSLYANAVLIEGTIRATDGNIGGLIIDTKGLSNNDFCLDASGLNIYGEGAKLAIGNVQLYNNLNSSAVILKTTDKFVIQGENNTAMAFMANEGESQTTMYIYITAITETLYGGVKQCTVTGSLKDGNANSIACMYDFTYSGKFLLTSLMGTKQEFSFMLEFEAGASDSNPIVLSSTGASFGFYDINGNLITIGVDDATTITDLYVGTKTQTKANNFIDVTGHLRATIDSKDIDTGYDFGSTDYRWRYIYARNGMFAGAIDAQIGEFSNYLHTNLLYSASGSVDNSDKNKKNTINTLSNAYNAVFDKLRPVTYKYNDGTSNRLHTGFVAQEVRDAVTSSGLTTQDFAGYCEWIDSDGNETCGLRYSEFIALCVNEIQRLKKRVAELENK